MVKPLRQTVDVCRVSVQLILISMCVYSLCVTISGALPNMLIHLYMRIMAKVAIMCAHPLLGNWSDMSTTVLKPGLPWNVHDLIVLMTISNIQQSRQVPLLFFFFTFLFFSLL